MGLLTSIRAFVHTHRKKLFLSTTVTLASLFFLAHHLHSLFLNHQRRIAEERFNREQIRRRFEQTQKDALYTIWALVPVLAGSLAEGFSVEKITAALRARRGGGGGKNNTEEASVSALSTSSSVGGSGIDSGSGIGSGGGGELVNEWSKKSKNVLWEDLKSQSLTKLLTLLYGNALLIVFTRLQLNILARREYLEDALKVASSKHGFSDRIQLIDRDSTTSPATASASTTAAYVNEQAYLSFSWWLLNRGWVVLKERVKSAVDEVFEDINPRVELTLDEFAILLSRAQKLIERVDEQGETFIAPVLLPPRNLEVFVMQQILDEPSVETLQRDGGDLRVLLDETSQYIASSSSLIVVSSLVNVGITTFLNYLAVSSAASASAAGKGEGVVVTAPGEIKVKLAVLLAGSTKAAGEFRSGQGNEYVNNMDAVAELDELSASVYSNFE
jgi:peroxin-3